MTPHNRARSHQVKVRVRITMATLWLVLFIPLLVVCNHLAQNGGGPLIALVGATMGWLILLPIVLVCGRRWFRDYNQYDFAVIQKAPEAPSDAPKAPAAYRDRPKPKLEAGAYLRPSDWPIIALLDPDWLNRYRFLPDEDIPQAVGDMCSEASHNWGMEHPNAPAAAKRPQWFDSMDEQAQALLAELQRCEIIGGTPTTQVDAVAYFQKNGRWPDEWYVARGMDIPAPGPDPDWYVPSAVGTLASAGALAGAVYLGAVRPIHKAMK